MGYKELGEPKCYRCGKPISFDSKKKSKTGKYIPLDLSTNTPHSCSKPIINSIKPKSSAKKAIVVALTSVIIISILFAGIGTLANSGNIQENSTVEQGGIIEQQNQAAKSTTSNDYSGNSYSANSYSGNAEYFSGKVTGIIDGDTIKVDGKSVRLALASTPELNTAMGQAAKNFVQEICPMGSSVTVDEDDGQTQGSYGRIIAKVTCNGVNLNQAIIEKGYGHLSFSFCDESEFSGDAWSGCGSSTSSYSSSNSYSGSYPSSGSNCDPNYSGVCIPKDSPDLDCADIGGPVRVTGSDHHGLDRDGDGIGCE